MYTSSTKIRISIVLVYAHNNKIYMKKKNQKD